MFTAGTDCGAKNTRTAIVNDGHVIAKSCVLTGFDLIEAIDSSFKMALSEAGLRRDQITALGLTGSGSAALSGPYTKVNDVRAMAAASNHLVPSGRTVIDVGAEEGRVARLNKTGAVLDFAINEKCAAGGGIFIESMARALDTSLEEIGYLALESRASIPMNAQCAIFAESEVISLIHSNVSKSDIARAIHDAMASRIASMIRRVGCEPEIVMLGGVAHNPGLVTALQRELGVERIIVPDYPEYASAIGAALVSAYESRI